jgi:protein SCO1/2
MTQACDSEKPKPRSVAGEKIYAMRGVITARNPQQSTITIDHEAIPGFMEAMVMDYPVRGAEVDRLPANGSRITARLHVTEDAFWVTDIQKSR